MQLKRAEGLAWRKLGDEMIVINLKKRMMYGLNAEAGKLWEALDSGLDLQTMVSGEDGSHTAFITALTREGLVSGGMESANGHFSEGHSGPRLLWKEEVQQFAGGCGFQAGQGGICDNAPLSS